MSEIEELQRRIHAAMERVAYGVTQIPAVASGEIDTLKSQLEEEKTANAQLEERIRVLKDKQSEIEAAAAKKAEQTQQRVSGIDTELQRLRMANEKLRQANAALRDANAAGLADPDLINSAMAAELEGLRAGRASDVAEADAIMSALAPLLTTSEAEGGSNA